MIQAPPSVWLEAYGRGAARGRQRRSFRFDEPVDQLAAGTDGVAALLRRVQAAVEGGLHAVGYVAYEAGPGCDPALAGHPAVGTLPPAWFGLYRRRRSIEPGQEGPAAGAFELGAWEAGLGAEAHARGVAAIRRYLAAGDVYQINYTFPLRASFAGDAAGLYAALCRAQGGADFCTFLDLGEAALLSASPELFFAVAGDGWLRTRPMKGTRPRGRWTGEDDALRQALATCPKERAENVMIVDLLRNDVGRVAQPGTVSVPALWETEAYDTVWQLTSTVQGRVRAGVGLAELFAALFPCGSVTGAPKVRATQIIRQLEAAPRGVYTGAIGFASPAAAGLEATFAVAIRTVTVDRRLGVATAGVGGGITYDSQAAAEYAECLDKARFLRRCGRVGAGARAPADFQLLETLLFEPGAGFYLVDRHLARLADSARYFGFAVDLAAVRARLTAAVAPAVADGGALRVRLTLARDGGVEVTTAPLDDLGDAPWTAVLAREPVDRSDVFLFHKTTRRQVYDRSLAAAQAAGAREVLLHNDDGELTECAVGNLVVARDGRRWTPPLDCGLLGGTFRAELLARGELTEGIVTVDDARAADAIWLINSVRRWVRLEVRWPGAARTDKETRACTG